MKRGILFLMISLMSLLSFASAEGTIPQTGWTTAVPAAYAAQSTHPGTVEELVYDTKDYAGNGADIQKKAYVYLPYGYDPDDAETRYDIIYLMHGWGGAAGEYFYMDNGAIRTMLDQMIERGDIKPVIAVSATFYTEGSSRDFSASIDQFRQFHLDFENALMPAVEGKYHTWAVSTSPEDLMASRDHRAFGGFSLGSVTTWLQFCHDTDYIRYFLPMSGSSWYYGTGWFIYHAVGTQDTVKSQSLMMADEMLSRPDTFTPDHYVFCQKDGGYHDFEAVREYMYNALPLFFR